MPELFIAVSQKTKEKFKPEFDERTAGIWREHVEFIELYEENKLFNDGNVEQLSIKHPNATIYAVKALTSKSLNSQKNIQRLTVPEMKGAINLYSSVTPPPRQVVQLFSSVFWPQQRKFRPQYIAPMLAIFAKPATEAQ
jgi:hypothetical protein